MRADDGERAGLTVPFDRANFAGRLGVLGGLNDMAQIDIAEAGAELPALAERAAAGEEIVLAEAGRPVARITAIAEQGLREPRKPGVAKHWVFDHDALMAPMDPEDLDAAEGLHNDEFGLTRSSPV